MSGKALREQDGRAQVDVHMRLPAPLVEGCKLVIEIERGVVDEAMRRAGPLDAARQQRAHLIGLGEIGDQRGGLSAGGADLGGERFRLLARAPIMDGDTPAVRGKIQRDGAADTARGAGDEGCLRGAHWHAVSDDCRSVRPAPVAAPDVHRLCAARPEELTRNDPSGVLLGI